MARVNKIGSVRELRDVRREIELRTWWAGERLTERAAGTFSPEGLLSMLAPEGSTLGRLMGGIGTGMATVRGIMHGLGSRRGKKGCGC